MSWGRDGAPALPLSHNEMVGMHHRTLALKRNVCWQPCAKGCDQRSGSNSAFRASAHLEALDLIRHLFCGYAPHGQLAAVSLRLVPGVRQQHAQLSDMQSLRLRCQQPCANSLWNTAVQQIRVVVTEDRCCLCRGNNELFRGLSAEPSAGRYVCGSC